MADTPKQRPLTDEEFDQLSPEQLQALGLADKAEGAPADFGGVVLPNPNHIKPQADTENGVQPTRLSDGIKLLKDNAKPATMDINNPEMNQIIPSLMQESSAKSSGKPVPAAAISPAIPKIGDISALPATDRKAPSSLGEVGVTDATGPEGFKASEKDYDRQIADSSTLQDRGLAQLRKLDYEKANPWGSENNHPGVLGKIGHVLGRIGNVAGDILAPGATTLIPGSDLNKAAERQGALGQIERGSALDLQSAESTQRRADAWAKTHPKDNQPGKTPPEQVMSDLLTGNGGKPRLDKDGKPYSFETAYSRVLEMGAENKPDKAPSEEDKRITNWLAANNLPDTPANRNKALSGISNETQRPPQTPVAVPDGKGGWNVVDARPGTHLNAGTHTMGEAFGKGSEVPGDFATAYGLASEDTGQTVLDKIHTKDPVFASGLEAMLHYQAEVPHRTQKGEPTRDQIIGLLHQIDPTYDDTQYKARAAVRSDYYGPNGDTNKRMASANRAAAAMQDLEHQDKALWSMGKGLNTSLAKLSDAFGGTYRKNLQASLTDTVNSVRDIVGDSPQFQQWAQSTNMDSTHRQMEEFIKEGKQMVGNFLTDRAQNWQRTMGKPFDFGLVAPNTRQFFGTQARTNITAGGAGGAATQVGKVITQNGQQFRVTAVDANGRPTAADPVH